MDAAQDKSSDIEKQAWTILAAIDDPEMPISIVDLGIIAGLSVVQDPDGAVVHIQISPTFLGCPALDLLNRQIRSSLLNLPGVKSVELEQVFDPPWTAQRITPAGKDRLNQYGITVGQGKTASTQFVACPYCRSEQTRLESPFGPTRCRSIYYCQSCHHSFEQIKSC